MPYSFRKGLLKVLGKQKEKHLAAGNELTSSAATNTREPPTTIRDGNPAAPTSAIDHPHNDPNTPRNNRNQVEDNLTPSEVTANQTTSKDDGAGAHGMYIFVDKPNTESRNVDIVALHGLNGHYSDTWTTTTAEGKRVNWLKELLPDIIPNARIMSFGYNSSVQFSKSTADISNFAEGLLAELMSWRTSEKEKARPIIFVCHSLGGIVFKQALVRARERDRFTDLLKNIRGVAFFGTPHAGSSTAKFGDVLVSILKASTLGSSTNSKLVADLKRNSETLRNITKSFVDRSKALQILTFFETEKMPYLNFQVVDEMSAVLNLPNETPVPINGNHNTICKFSDSAADQKRFRVVWAHLKEMADKLNESNVSYTTKLSKSDQISCLRGFYHKNYEAFRNRNPDRVADTCEWFLDHPEYDKWKTRESSSLLWVSADPGCGKSVLAKFLVDHLRKPKSKEDRPEFVCHFFFKDDSDEQRSGVLALRALLHQIFTDDQALLRHAFDAFEFKGLDMFDEFESLWDILSNITRDPEAINLVIILDGLDECESVSQGKLLENINKLYGHKDLNTKPFLRMILLSRPETIIQNLFCQNAAIVRLRGEDEPENISKDVELVVRSHIKDLVGKGLPLDTLLVLQKALIDRADRTFLWITLIIDLLEDAAREGASQKELEDLLDTRDIDALYAHLLQKFVTMDRSKKLLQMVLAAARPLTLKEVNVALAVSPQQFSFKELKSNLRYPIENHIKTLCGHFIRIIRSKVYLVHQTARDFLLQQKTNKELTTPLGTWQHLTTLEECQVVLLRTCISYLFLTTVAEDKKCDATGEFLDYASEFWPTGFARTNHHILDDISDDISDDIYDDMWDDMSDKIIDKGISSKHLEIGCRDIFDEIVDITLHRSEQSSQGTNQWFSAHELILHLDNWRFVKTRYWLSHTVHQMFDLPIVRLLGDNAVNVNATDTSGSTLLHYACANGSPELVKTLLRKGADVFAVDSSRNTAMHVLVQPLPVQNRRPYIYSVDFDNDNRLILIAEELLANHVDINALTESKETPLHLASERGLSLFANWLVSHGADINAVNENSETILHSAVKSENAATIDAILDCNVDLTQVNGEGKTAFEALTRRPTIDGSVAARVRAYGMPELDSEDIQRLEYQDI